MCAYVALCVKCLFLYLGPLLAVTRGMNDQTNLFEICNTGRVHEAKQYKNWFFDSARAVTKLDT